VRAWVLVGILLAAASCGGGRDGVRAELGAIDPADPWFAIESTCAGGEFSVDFDPEAGVSVDGMADASLEEIEVSCGRPERVPIGAEDGSPAPPDFTDPVTRATTLSCDAGGDLEVQTNPIWGRNAVVGSSLAVVRGGQVIVAASLKRSQPDGGLHARLAWSRSTCRTA
jgi:hypothetical protein